MISEDKLIILEKTVGLLGQLRYENMTDLKSFAACEGNLEKDAVYNACRENIKGMNVNVGDSFIGRDRYLWLNKTVKMPANKKGHLPVGIFDFGKTGINNKKGFESLLYVNGLPYQGVDGNHQEVVFNEYASKTVNLTFLLWSGLEGGGYKKRLRHRIRRAQFGLLNEKTDELYYLLKNLSDTLIIIEDEKLSAELSEIGLKACEMLKSTDDEAVSCALKYVKDSLEGIENGREETVYVSGHTHIDVMWLWRLKHTREKTQRSFSTVLKLMKEYPEFRFIQSQPQLYAFLKEDNPYLYEKIKQNVKEGNWEADGGMWLEADCNLPSGESLVRQFFHGIDFFRKEFGRECEYLWLPDVFGYSSALPQIMKLFHIRSFMTTKISWNETNEFPYSLFLWRGLDGSEVMTYFMNTPNNNVRSVNFGKVSNYSAELAPMTAYGAWKRFKNKDLSKDILISFGYGDGGGGPNREMIKNGRAMKLIPGLPKVEFSTPSVLFNKMHENIKDRDVPVYDGELYLELHRATYTTHGEVKRYNRKLEYRLLEDENLNVLSSLNKGRYDKETLDKCWKTLLLNQFHDSLPGSSIREVYQDLHKSYEGMNKDLKELEDRTLSSLMKEDNSWNVMRFSDVRGNELIRIPERRKVSFIKDGKKLLSQRVKGGYLVCIDAAPYKPEIIETVKGYSEETSPFIYDLKERKAETPFHVIRWNENGFIESLYDKELNKEFIKGQGNILRCYVNRPKLHDAWDIDIEYLDEYDDMIPDDVSLIEEGPLRMTLRFRYHFNKSYLIQDVMFYSQNARIDFKNTVSWHEDHRLLRALFELNLKADKAAYDIQFGHIFRNTGHENSTDAAKFEVCAHKWMDYSDDKCGISLMNDCKYGHSARDNVIGISLLNSPKYPDPTADMGRHEFTYSLLTHEGSLSLKTIDESMLLNQPSKAFRGSLCNTAALIRKDCEGIKTDAFKKAEDGDGYILHLHEALGINESVRLESEYGIKRYAECDLLEQYETVEEGNAIRADFRPFEIKCFRVWFE